MESAHEATTRIEELSTNLQKVRDRIGSACRSAGRSSDEVTLIVVTKFFPVADIDRLARLGVTDIGESRDQEASAKVSALRPEVRRDLQVHFIGRLQSNKVASLASYADTVHSVDRVKLVGGLERSAGETARDLSVLIQVSLTGDSAGQARGGIPLDGLDDLVNSVAAARHLNLRGLMAVAPLGMDPAAAFTELATVARGVRASHPEASWISAGMSADLEAAVLCGATHLRVGSAILGSRPPLG
jgi:pyridoxal phosphate enzyme (YggS family)